MVKALRQGSPGAGTGVQSSTEREEENQEGETWGGRWGQTMPGNLMNRVGLYPKSSEVLKVFKQ